MILMSFLRIHGCYNASAELVASCLQALNINFNVMSASDPDYKCLQFLQANFPNKLPTHWYRDMKSQCSGQHSCLRHPFARTCDPCPVDPDLGICGTPCHAFSTQRCTRFKPGSVEAHAECDIAFGEFLSWLKRFQPKVQIFEQVTGFSMPFNSQTSETPLQRSLALAC